MSSRIFQSVILQMKDATNRMIGVIDSDGAVISCSDSSLIGSKWLEMIDVLSGHADPVVVTEDKTFKTLASWGASFDYAVFVEGTDEKAKEFCSLAAVALNGAKIYYEEKHDKATFIKNIITDNILPGDVYIRAKELRFPSEQQRAVFLIRQVDKTDIATVDVLNSLFTDKQHDYVISINETDIVVVKQVSVALKSKLRGIKPCEKVDGNAVFNHHKQLFVEIHQFIEAAHFIGQSFFKLLITAVKKA